MILIEVMEAREAGILASVTFVNTEGNAWPRFLRLTPRETSSSKMRDRNLRLTYN